MRTIKYSEFKAKHMPHLNEEENKEVDTITVDVPLFIRLLEYAKEDAKTDMDLHRITENILQLSKAKSQFSMKDYATIVNKGLK